MSQGGKETCGEVGFVPVLGIGARFVSRSRKTTTGAEALQSGTPFAALEAPLFHGDRNVRGRFRYQETELLAVGVGLAGAL
jgi:hypothetical protein